MGTKARTGRHAEEILLFVSGVEGFLWGSNVLGWEKGDHTSYYGGTWGQLKNLGESWGRESTSEASAIQVGSGQFALLGNFSLQGLTTPEPCVWGGDLLGIPFKDQRMWNAVSDCGNLLSVSFPRPLASSPHGGTSRFLGPPISAPVWSCTGLPLVLVEPGSSYHYFSFLFFPFLHLFCLLAGLQPVVFIPALVIPSMDIKETNISPFFQGTKQTNHAHS